MVGAVACSSTPSAPFVGASPDAGPTASATPGEVGSGGGLTLLLSDATTHNVMLAGESAGFPRPNNVFVGLTVQLRNDSYKRSAPVAPNHFQLRTNAGLVYNAWSGSGRIDDACVGIGEVAIGGTTTACRVIFETPATDEAAVLLYAHSTSDEGRASAPIPATTAGAPGYCDVRHYTSDQEEEVQSEGCDNCLYKNCLRLNSMEPLPKGTCASAPYCACEYAAFAKKGTYEAGRYAQFEGCVQKFCFAECTAK